MTSRERVHAVLEGKPADRMPATALYNQLYHLDHFAELTGRPQWQLHQWLHSAPDEHVATYAKLVDAAPFETLQPQTGPPRHIREETEFFEKDGRIFRRRRGETAPFDVHAPGEHAMDYRANEVQFVFDRKDAAEQIRPVRADQQLASGVYDYVVAAVGRFGPDHFIISGGVVGTVYSCASYLGQSNTLAMMVDAAGLLEYCCAKILEQNMETIRALATAGGDAIYIDDATTTSDMISVAHYERFSLPYMREMVGEIQRLGRKAIAIYFGGVMDRLDQIAATGADGLLVETSMKGYSNDIGAIAEAIGGRTSLFGNIDPVGVLEKASDEQLAAEVARQARAGRKARGFLISPASPITPGTPLRRVRTFLETARISGRGIPLEYG